jgi:hypothetical protein
MRDVVAQYKIVLAFNSNPPFAFEAEQPLAALSQNACGLDSAWECGVLRCPLSARRPSSRSRRTLSASVRRSWAANRVHSRAPRSAPSPADAASERRPLFRRVALSLLLHGFFPLPY